MGKKDRREARERGAQAQKHPKLAGREARANSSNVLVSEEKLSAGKWVSNATIGLPNLGNTCFMNATLQCLLKTRVLLREYDQETTPSMSEFEPSSVVTAVNALLQESQTTINTSAADEDDILQFPPKKGAQKQNLRKRNVQNLLSPNRVLNAVRANWPQFKGARQQDSHEFLLCLLSTLQEEEEAVRRRLGSDSKLELPWERRINNSRAMKTFGGVLCSRIHCERCGQDSHVVEESTAVSLEIPGAASIVTPIQFNPKVEENEKRLRKKRDRRSKRDKTDVVDDDDGGEGPTQPEHGRLADDEQKPEKERKSKGDGSTGDDDADDDGKATDHNDHDENKSGGEANYVDAVAVDAVDVGAIDAVDVDADGENSKPESSVDKAPETLVNSDLSNHAGSIPSIPSSPDLQPQQDDPTASTQQGDELAQQLASISISEAPTAISNTNNHHSEDDVDTDTDGQHDKTTTLSPEEQQRLEFFKSLCESTISVPNKEGDDSIVSCLDAFTRKEELRVAMGNGYLCEKCGRKGKKAGKSVTSLSDATKKMLFLLPPRVLVCHLKRLHPRVKFTAHVSFPEILDIAPYLWQHEDQIHETKYRLFGCVVHQGGRQGGHYIAYTRGVNGWNYISDSSVLASSSSDVKRCQAYMLFYERLDALTTQSS